MPPAPARLITSDLFAQVLEQARAAPRRRMNFNFHASLEENPSRFLNVMLAGTYITPHRHTEPPKAESFLVLAGRIAFFLFDDAGAVNAAHVIEAGGPLVGIDVSPGVWHTAAVLSEHVVCFEVKPGPYSPAADKDFAPWAPREGSPEAPAYLEALISRVGC